MHNKYVLTICLKIVVILTVYDIASVRAEVFPHYRQLSKVESRKPEKDP